MEPDPPVLQGVKRKGTLEWFPEHPRCSDFLISMVYWQAVNGGLPYFCFAPTPPETERTVKSRLQLVWQDHGFQIFSSDGGVVCLIDHGKPSRLEPPKEVQAAGRTEEDLRAVGQLLGLTWDYTNLPKQGAPKVIDRSQLSEPQEEESAELKRLAARAPKDALGQGGVIKATLLEMLGRQDRKSFVIVLEKTAEKIVQFTASTRRPLVLDLPTISLSPEEKHRAEAFFSQRGASKKPLSADKKDFAYQLDLKDEVDRATELTFAVFREVYQLPEGCELAVIKGRDAA
jgi:hypothetical protein